MKRPGFTGFLFFVLTGFAQPPLKKDPADFLPNGYVIFEKIYGDLNKDGIDDLVFIIKGTDKDKIVREEYRGVLDRNRRGIIVLWKEKNGYREIVKNYDCFSSENEDGGVYFPPELSVEISKGKLYLHYSHGRYGYWKYTFRYKNPDFELIGYDSSSDFGPIIQRETSINFLTKKKQIRENINQNPYQESGDEIFKETWSAIKSVQPIKLSVVKDFDELNIPFEE